MDSRSKLIVGTASALLLLAPVSVEAGPLDPFGIPSPETPRLPTLDLPGIAPVDPRKLPVPGGLHLPGMNATDLPDLDRAGAAHVTFYATEHGALVLASEGYRCDKTVAFPEYDAEQRRNVLATTCESDAGELIDATCNPAVYVDNRGLGWLSARSTCAGSGPNTHANCGVGGIGKCWNWGPGKNTNSKRCTVTSVVSWGYVYCYW